MNTDLARAMLEGLWRNPIDPREWVLLDKRGNPLAGVILDQVNPSVGGSDYIELVYIRAMKKGGARKLMEILVERADELGATIVGTVKPLRAQAYDMKKMSKRNLLKWYREFGFETDGDEILREPGVSGYEG